MTGKPVSLYIHVPFCRRRCHYCHFYVVPSREPLQQLFVEALLAQWFSLHHLCRGYEVVSIYFGGGTPSLLGAGRLNALLEAICARTVLAADCEITLEANPEDVDRSFITDVLAGGFNRLSLGVQSHDDGLLMALGRHHGCNTALGAVAIASCAGMDNISADLMYDLPGQTLSSWQGSLAAISDLPLQHLSLYNLTIEPGTLFFRRQQQIRAKMPDDQTSATMFSEACSYLATKGFEQYEISAFALSGKRSRHNLGYWTNRPFLGLGPSAFSYWEGRRYSHVADLNKYAELVKKGVCSEDFSEQLSLERHLCERLAVNLRLIEGVCLADFPPFTDALRQRVDQLIAQELLIELDGYLKLTACGLLFYDTVAAEIIE